ncbi:hypothetical protein BDW62DRAFT_86677 [Aspergillus aurantiobrunneus]
MIGLSIIDWAPDRLPSALSAIPKQGLGNMLCLFWIGSFCRLRHQLCMQTAVEAWKTRHQSPASSSLPFLQRDFRSPRLPLHTLLLLLLRLPLPLHHAFTFSFLFVFLSTLTAIIACCRIISGTISPKAPGPPQHSTPESRSGGKNYSALFLFYLGSWTRRLNGPSVALASVLLCLLALPPLPSVSCPLSFNLSLPLRPRLERLPFLTCLALLHLSCSLRVPPSVLSSCSSHIPILLHPRPLPPYLFYLSHPSIFSLLSIIPLFPSSDCYLPPSPSSSPCDSCLARLLAFLGSRPSTHSSFPTVADATVDDAHIKSAIFSNCVLVDSILPVIETTLGSEAVGLTRTSKP